MWLQRVRKFQTLLTKTKSTKMLIDRSRLRPWWPTPHRDSACVDRERLELLLQEMSDAHQIEKEQQILAQIRSSGRGTHAGRVLLTTKMKDNLNRKYYLGFSIYILRISTCAAVAVGLDRRASNASQKSRYWRRPTMRNYWMRYCIYPDRKIPAS